MSEMFETRVEPCPNDCDDGWVYTSRWEWEDAALLCSCCDGTGQVEVEYRPIALEDLVFNG